MAEIEVILTSVSIEIESPLFSGSVTVEGDTAVIVEGQGESTVEAATNGGVVVPVVSEDIKTKVGMVKWEMPASVASADISRSIKANPPGTVVVRVSGTDAAGNRFGRTLRQGTQTNDPEKAIQNQGKIPLELKGSPLAPS